MTNFIFQKIQKYYDKYHEYDNFQLIIKEKLDKVISKIEDKHSNFILEEKEKREKIKNVLGINIDKIVGDFISPYQYFKQHSYTVINNDDNYTTNLFNHILMISATLLQNIKDEYLKSHEAYSTLYSIGIDVANYENKSLDFVVFFLADFLELKTEEIDWWLFESVDKIYYVNDKEFNVENAFDFIMFNINFKNSKI